MNTYLLSRMLGLSRFLAREEAKNLALAGKMAKARRLIFQTLVERAQRHGENSDESLETLTWLAEIHFEKAVAALHAGHTLLKAAVESHYLCLTPALSCLKRADTHLNSAKSALHYAERQIEANPRASLFYARLELALFLLKATTGKETSQEHLNKCIEAVQTLFLATPEHRLLETIDALVEAIYAHYSEASEYAAVARELAARAEEERVLQEEHVAEMAILLRPG